MCSSEKLITIGDTQGSIISSPNGRLWQWKSVRHSLTYQYYEKPPLCFICKRVVDKREEPLWYLCRVVSSSRSFDVKFFCHHCKQIYYALTLHYQNQDGDKAYLLKWLEPIYIMNSVNDLQANFPISWQCLEEHIRTFQEHMRVVQEYSTSSNIPIDSSSNNQPEKKEITQQMLITNLFREWIDNGILIKDIAGKVPLKDLRRMFQQHDFHIGQRNKELENAIEALFQTEVALISFGNRGTLRGFHGWRLDKEIN
jgi:hypothetical protein